MISYESCFVQPFSKVVLLHFYSVKLMKSGFVQLFLKVGFVDRHLLGNLSNDLVLAIKVVDFGSASHRFDDDLTISVRILRFALDAIGVLLFEQSNAFAVAERDLLDQNPNLFVIIILLGPNPLILYVDSFSLLVGAMNRSFVYVKSLQILYYDIGDSVNITNLAHLLQVGELKFDGLDKICNVHSVLAILV